MDMAAAIQAAKDRAAEKSEQPIASDEHKNNATDSSPTDGSPTDGSNTDDDGGLANDGVDNAPHTDVSTSNEQCGAAGFVEVTTTINDATAINIELEKLRKENDEADTAALLSAELVALRGRHEEERRQLIKTAQDLRFRNEELEMRCITLQNMVGAGVETTTRSDGDNDDDSSTKLVATLEEQLRNAEHRATVLEQRLNIVKESGDSVIQSLNEELADIAEDRARVEAAMIKELSLLDSQRRTERDEYEKRIQEWIAHDANRKTEVEDYEARIGSLLSTVRMMSTDCNMVTTSSSWADKEAEDKMYHDLVSYIQQFNIKSGGNGKRSLVMSINDAFDLQFNANPNIADDMVDYYRARPELKEFTLKSELPRMDYEVLAVDKETGNDIRLVETDEVRFYLESLKESNTDDYEEVDIILRAANQSLLADPLAMMTGEGNGKLVHSGSFHSTVIATVCSFKLDLRREGERRVKVQCELAICVPSGYDGTSEHSEGSEDKAATLEIARVVLVIQFSPSETATPSGPLVKYSLMDIIPTITNYEEGSDNAIALRSAAAVLARDRNTHIQGGAMNAENEDSDVTSNYRSRFFSKVKQMSDIVAPRVPSSLK